VSVRRYVLPAVAACCGIGCIVIGIEWANPPDLRGEAATGFLVAHAYGRLHGWCLIVLDGLMLCGSALALVLGRRARDAEPAAREDRVAPPLPEARAHFRSPDEGNGK